MLREEVLEEIARSARPRAEKHIRLIKRQYTLAAALCAAVSFCLGWGLSPGPRAGGEPVARVDFRSKCGDVTVLESDNDSFAVDIRG